MRRDKIHVSTITGVANINYELHLDKVFECFEIDDELLYSEYGKTKHDKCAKGEPPGNKTVGKRFDNQNTLIWNLGELQPNMKVFKNGKVQVTGVRSVEMGEKMIDLFVQRVRKHPSVLETDDGSPVVYHNGFQVCLINADFRMGCSIRRDVLYRILVSMRMDCTYEPCIYPGVKLRYFHTDQKKGVCTCAKPCGEKKQKNDVCKRTTLSFFQSGCVIITGAANEAHIDEVCSFVNNLTTKHMDDISMKDPLDPIRQRVKHMGKCSIQRGKLIHAYRDFFVTS